MTVSSSTRIDTGTTGTGAEQIISFTIPVQVDTEVKVLTKNPTTGAIVNLVKDTDYSVSLTADGNNNFTGSITTLTPFQAASVNIYIYREVTDSATYEPANNDDFDAATLESAYDKLYMMIAELREELSRCVKIPLPETNTVEVDDDITRASTTVGFDSSSDIETT
jgi:hypothetical protein